MKNLMKYTSLFVGLVMAIGIAAADAKKDTQLLREAADRMFSIAKPVKDIPTVVDSKGCLWGLGENHGQVAAFKVLEPSGAHYCRPVK